MILGQIGQFFGSDLDWSILRNFQVLQNCESAGVNLRETAKHCETSKKDLFLKKPFHFHVSIQHLSHFEADTEKMDILKEPFHFSYLEKYVLF